MGESRLKYSRFILAHAFSVMEKKWQVMAYDQHDIFITGIRLLNTWDAICGAKHRSQNVFKFIYICKICETIQWKTSTREFWNSSYVFVTLLTRFSSNHYEKFKWHWRITIIGIIFARDFTKVKIKNSYWTENSAFPLTMLSVTSSHIIIFL